MVSCTSSVWPGGTLEPEAPGVIMIPLRPLLLAVQGKLSVLDELVSVTMQVHWPPESWHCEAWSANILFGLTEISGGACTVRVVETETELVPILINIVSV